jgi:hypothetical protein
VFEPGSRFDPNRLVVVLALLAGLFLIVRTGYRAHGEAAGLRFDVGPAEPVSRLPP